MTRHIITNCTVQDTVGLARNNIPAFWEDLNWRYPWTDFGLEKLVEATEARYPHNQLLRDRDTLRHFKAVDPDTGEIVGYIRWKLPQGCCKSDDGTLAWPEGQVPDVSEAERDALVRQAEEAEWRPREVENDDFDGVFARRRDFIVAEKAYIILEYLAVHPKNQGKGIGTALVQHGLQAVQKLGINVFVVAFSGGLKLYQNFGFKVLETFDQDARRVGGTEHYIVHLMELQVKSS